MGGDYLEPCGGFIPDDEREDSRGVLYYVMAVAGSEMPFIRHLEKSESRTVETVGDILDCEEIAGGFVEKLKQVGGLGGHGGCF